VIHNEFNASLLPSGDIKFNLDFDKVGNNKLSPNQKFKLEKIGELNKVIKNLGKQLEVAQKNHAGILKQMQKAEKEGAKDTLYELKQDSASSRKNINALNKSINALVDKISKLAD